MASVRYDVDTSSVRALEAKRFERAAVRAMRKAGSTALRDMRSEASKRVRRRKRIKARAIRDALILRRPKVSRLDALEWRIDVAAKPVPLTAYPHKQLLRIRSRKGSTVGATWTQRAGVQVEINRGRRTIVKNAFVAHMDSGHRGIWARRGARRLPIGELHGSRVSDALLHEGEAQAVAERGLRTLSAAFERLLALETAKP